MEMQNEDIATDENLIIIVQGFPILWDNTKREFRDETQKINAWVSVAEIMQQEVSVVQADWKRLRVRFTREVKKADLPSGSGSTSGSTWEHLQALQFLKGVVRPRKTSGKVKVRPQTSRAFDMEGDLTPSPVTMDEESTDFDAAASSATPVTDPKEKPNPHKRLHNPTPISSGKRLRPGLEDLLCDTIQTLTASSTAPVVEAPPKSTNELICLTAKSVLDNLPRADQVELQDKIMQLCFAAQRKN